MNFIIINHNIEKDNGQEPVQLEIPILPGLANNLKQRYGIKAVIESGINLSEAVKYYGKEWLEE